MFTLLYLDPGTGSVIVQAILAGAAAVFIFFKYQGRKVKAFFMGGKRRAASKTTDVDPSA